MDAHVAMLWPPLNRLADGKHNGVISDQKDGDNVEGKKVMQSYTPRVLDRRLKENWARAAKEGPRILMNLRVDFWAHRSRLGSLFFGPCILSILVV